MAKKTTDEESKPGPMEHLKAQGIPVERAQFYAAVNNGLGTPENYFSSKSDSPGRRVEMWWTPIGLVCLHNSKHFVVPPSTVIFFNVKE